MARLISIQPLNNYRAVLAYSDGTTGTLDLSHLAGKGVFKAWIDRSIPFDNAYIHPETGAIAWSELIDICPWSAYQEIKMQKSVA